MKIAIAFIICIAVLTGCKSHSYDPDLFDRIRIGQTQEQVEAILGEKCYSHTHEEITTVNYLSPPGQDTLGGKPFTTVQVVYKVHNRNLVVIKKRKMTLMNQAR